MSRSSEFDPARFARRIASPRGFELAYAREGNAGGPPLLLLHGWPQTRRSWWPNIAPLASVGFDVIAPDLRGFGDSAIAPDGFGDVVSHSLDLYALLRAELGLERVSVVAGDLGGAIAQDLSLRFPGFVDRIVLFNSPLPFLSKAMAGMRTRAPAAARDYFLRQGKDADALAAELDTEEKRRDYIAGFYTSRHWAAAGRFTPSAVRFLTEPFSDADKLRASFKTYESVFDPKQRVAPPLFAQNPTPTAVLFGTADRVMPPDFDLMTECVFPNRLEVKRLDDAGHFLQWEATEALHGTIEAHCQIDESPVAGETRALVSLGSNLGEREFQLCAAVAALRTTPGIRDVRVSRIYETDPVGPGDQGAYLNAAASLETTLSARALLTRLQSIEAELGRTRTSTRNEARTLDLDILYFGSSAIEEPGLSVPHPRIESRPFVLEPLCDLVPKWVPPGGSDSIENLAERVRDERSVRVRN